MFTLLVATYVVVVFLARVVMTSHQAQQAFRAGLTNRQAPLLESGLGGLWRTANLLVPEPRWCSYVSNAKILQAWQILHHIDAERDQGSASDIQMALAAEFDRQKGKNSEVNKLLASRLASPPRPPAQPVETAPVSGLAQIAAFLLRKPSGNDDGSTIAATYSDTESQRRAALRAARRINDAQRDRIAAQQADLARRGLFLLVLGGFAVGIAGHLLHHELLLGVGAGAGILSRLSSRSNEVKRSGTDYGVAWTKLIVSPLVGALGALFGVFLIGGLGNAGFFGPSTCPLITPVVIDLAPNPVTTTKQTTSTIKAARAGNVVQASPNETTIERSSTTEHVPAKTSETSESPEQSPEQSPSKSLTQPTTINEQVRGPVAASILTPPTDTVLSPEPTTEPTDLGTVPLPPEKSATTTATTTATVTTLPTIVAPAQPCPTSVNPATPGMPPVKQDRESTTTIALAIVLGFSERLFARMIGRSENYITGELEGTNTKGANG